MKKLLLVSLLIVSAIAAKAQVPSLNEGIKYLDNENFSAALEVFNAIAKNDPKNGTIYYYIGEVGYQSEDYATAKKNYEKGLSINPQCAECKIGLGKLLLDAGKPAEAEEQFQSAIRLDKKNADTYGLIGISYLENKKPNGNKAVEYLTQARDMNPKKATYWAHLGDAYYMIGNNGEAMTAFQIAVEKDSTNTDAYISMARIWAAAKQLDIAIPLLEKAIRLSPNDARPYKDLIELYIKDGQYDKVTPLLEKYLSLIGTDVGARVRFVKFLTFQAKDYDRAILEGEKLLKTNPEQYTVHRWLAWSYAEKGDYQKSYDHSVMLFEEIGKKDDRATYPSDYDYWGKAAFKIGLLDESWHVYKKYMDLDTTPAKKLEIYGMFAKAYYDVKNWEQAIIFYNRKASLKELSVGDEYYLGISYYYFDKDAEADSSFAKVLKITPDYAPAWLMRAKIANSMDTLEPKLFLAKEYYENYIIHALKDKEKNKKNIMDASHVLAAYWVNQVGNKVTKSECEMKDTVTYTQKEWDELCLTKAKEYYELILSLNPEDEIAIDNLQIVTDNIKIVREQKKRP